jgi:hypothetical protein
MPDPGTDPWSDRKIDIAEKYLDRMLAKMESAKADLDRNWLGQISSIAISLALIAGLGSAVANKLLSDPRSDDILYIVLPLVNSYFFVRFGLIAGVCSKSRYNTEQLANELIDRHDLPTSFDAKQVYQTNSYFEWAHHDFSRETISFLLTIPIVFALNHSITLYLIFKVLGWSCWFWISAGAYLAVAGAAYVAYYRSNKKNTGVLLGRRKNSFIVLVIGISAVATIAMLFVLPRVDRDPRHIDFRARPGPSVEGIA